MPEISSKSILYAFDCDHTIVDIDSDVAITQITGKPLPPSISDLCDGHYWTDYMNAVFKHLHQEGITLHQISETLQQLPLVNGIDQVFQKISQEISNPNSASKFVVISDANDFGIMKILSNINTKINPKMPLQDSKCSLITNTSFITEDGCLQINPYENQFSCKFCPKNLCKGSALLKYITKEGPFDQVVYVGDGKNDICPVIKLSEKDIVMARKGFQLDQIIQAGERNGHVIELQAEVRRWSDGWSLNSIF